MGKGVGKMVKGVGDEGRVGGTSSDYGRMNLEESDEVSSEIERSYGMREAMNSKTVNVLLRTGASANYSGSSVGEGGY